MEMASQAQQVLLLSLILIHLQLVGSHIFIQELVARIVPMEVETRYALMKNGHTSLAKEEPEDGKFMQTVKEKSQVRLMPLVSQRIT